MNQGTIVLTPFPFTDLSTSKRRPALVMSTDNEHKTDIVVAYISSKITDQISETDFMLKASHKDFRSTGLQRDSIIKLNKLVTIDKNLFTGELGFVSKEILDEVILKLKIVFGI